MRFYTIIILLLCTITTSAQELNAVVIINAEQTGRAELQVFRTLERSLTEFVNNTKWTDRTFKTQEKIECSFNFIVSELDGNNFRASVQVGASRPVYGSNYNSPIFNFNDEQFDFVYTEFQPLIFDPNTSDSNLVSVMAYYVYTIIGLDASTFKLGDGDSFYQKAQQIVTTAQPNGGAGWSPQDGTRSRYRLSEDLLSANFREFNAVMYSYHRTGLDTMAADKKRGKQKIATTILQLEAMYKKRPNNFLTRVFFDTKAQEISDMFSGGPQVNITELLDVLNNIALTKSTYWKNIKF